jgi:hypothetical protein
MRTAHPTGKAELGTAAFYGRLALAAALQEQ